LFILVPVMVHLDILPSALIPDKLTKAGLDVYDAVIILRTQQAVEAFTSMQVKLGSDIGVAVGPMGAGVSLDAGKDRNPVWSCTSIIH
jgi:lipid-binding SYLF domain-containing protein